MNIEDIDKSLPNGFHDAFLCDIKIDYIKKEASFLMEIWIGNPHAKDKGEREKYKIGRLKLLDFCFCAIEPPDQKYSYLKPGSLRIDFGKIDDLKSAPPMRLPENLPAGIMIYWFFVQKWNAFIYIASHDAEFDWE